MAILRYYQQVIFTAFRHSLDWAQGAIFLLLIVVGAVSYFRGLPDMTAAISGWQAAALVFGSIIAVRLLLAPYWMHRELKALIPSPLKSDLSVTLHDGMAYEAMSVDSAGQPLPDARAWLVRVKNNGSQLLQKCQLMLDDQPVSRHFELRREEHKDFPVLRMQERVNDPRPIAYFLDPETWKILDGSGLLVNPGIHEIKVLSADSHPASLNVELSTTAVMPPREWRLATCV